jgi:hypothetical protein
MPTEDAELVVAYWREHRLTQGSRAERLQVQAETASAEVSERMSGDLDAALDLLDNLLSDEAADIPYLAAGPLEDLLVERGPSVAEGVAERCRRSTRWNRAVSAVWLDDREWATVPQLHPWLPKRK